AGRLWTVSAAAIAGLTGSSFIAGTNIEAIFGLLRGPWAVTLQNILISPNTTVFFVPTFDNTNLTFTATITPTSPAGPAATDPGTWTLSPPERFAAAPGNPQAHLTITDAQGVVLFSNDIFLENVDMFASVTTGTGSLGAPFGATWIKFAP